MVWPFGRKNRRHNRTEDAKAISTEENMSRTRVDQAASTKTQSQTLGSRTDNQKARRGGRKISKNPASSSAASPIVKPLEKTSARGRDSSPKASSHLYQQNFASHSSIVQENFTVGERPPTLRAQRTRNDNTIPRRKSSKRKAEDVAREEKVRSMSQPIPIPKPRRPASHTGGVLRKDPPLSHRFERPASDASLSLQQSIASSLDPTMESHSFKVGSFGLLTPRPTIKYAASPLHTGPDSRTSTRLDKRPAIPEEDASSKKRIDELADELDTGTLRQLMERDARRRERKKKMDRETLERKLRKAGRQREGESQRGRKQGQGQQVPDPGPSAMEGVERTETSITRTPPPERDINVMESPPPNVEVERPRQSPQRLRVSTSPGLLHAESPRNIHMSQASPSPSASPVLHAKNRGSYSQLSALGRESTPEIPEYPTSERRESSQSATQGGSWATFFKRGGTRAKRNSVDRGRRPPSEFSNTSRESFARQVPPPPVVPRTFRRSSGTPQRTRSKFREDLPEFPISPPDSRVQSPEVQETTRDSKRASGGTYSTHQDDRASRHLSIQSQLSESHPPAAVLSQSLASVDSEGSWLSGRPVKRSSLPINHPLRQQQSETQRDVQENQENRDPHDVTEDEYFKRLTPGPERRQQSRSATRRASSTAIEFSADSDNESEFNLLSQRGEAEEGTWHGTIKRQPTLVKQHSRAKSREGLLNEFHEQEQEGSSSEQEEEGETSPESDAKPAIMRATSVDYGKHHARRISAGSARLLNVSRASSESKRLSSTEPSRAASPGISTLEETNAS
ncbi:MAG: hypothetical protein Q9160_001661 [Pyrenula sp. 1 TL-2023]